MPLLLAEDSTGKPTAPLVGPDRLLEVRTTAAEPAPTFTATPGAGEELEGVYVAGLITSLGAPYQTALGATELSTLVSAAPVRLLGIAVRNPHTSVRWIRPFNRVDAPGDGALISEASRLHTSIPFPARQGTTDGWAIWTAPAPIRCSLGLAIAVEGAPDGAAVALAASGVSLTVYYEVEP